MAKEALRVRDGDVISKLAALFVDLVKDARNTGTNNPERTAQAR